MTETMFTFVVAGPVDTPPDRVYLDYYHLNEAPFAITPDPEFLFSASCHQQVLDKIGYAIDGRRIRDIAGVEFSTAAATRDGLGIRLAARRVHVDDGDIVAVGRKALCRRRADAPARPRDEGHSPAQHHLPPPPSARRRAASTTVRNSSRRGSSPTEVRAIGSTRS